MANRSDAYYAAKVRGLRSFNMGGDVKVITPDGRVEIKPYQNWGQFLNENHIVMTMKKRQNNSYDGIAVTQGAMYEPPDEK